MKKIGVNQFLISLGLLTGIVIGGFAKPADAAFTRTKQLGSVRGGDADQVDHLFTLVEQDSEGKNINDTRDEFKIGYFQAAVADYISISATADDNSLSSSFFISKTFSSRSTGAPQPLSDLTQFNNLNELIGTSEFQSNGVSFERLSAPLDLKAEQISKTNLQYSFINPSQSNLPVLSFGLSRNVEYSRRELDELTNKLPSIVNMLLSSDKNFLFIDRLGQKDALTFFEKSFPESKTTTPEPGSIFGLLIFLVGGLRMTKILK